MAVLAALNEGLLTYIDMRSLVKTRGNEIECPVSALYKHSAFDAADSSDIYKRNVVTYDYISVS